MICFLGARTHFTTDYFRTGFGRAKKNGCVRLVGRFAMAGAKAFKMTAESSNNRACTGPVLLSRFPRFDLKFLDQRQIAKILAWQCLHLSRPVFSPFYVVGGSSHRNNCEMTTLSNRKK